MKTGRARRAESVAVLVINPSQGGHGEQPGADIDLLVMGAYGHSRPRELVLGGVTRAIFQQMTVPVLMSRRCSCSIDRAPGRG